jgi:PST family polysaccharide transporter
VTVPPPDEPGGRAEEDHPGGVRGIAVSGARWGVVSAIAEQGGSLLSTAVLARLLTPGDFGVVAAVTIVVTLLALLGSVGFGASLIRRDDVDEELLSSTFWAATGVGLALTAVGVVGAPVFARMLGQPDIGPYIAAISPLLLVSMLSNVSEALLQRRLQFSAVYTADVLAIVVNVAVSIGAAVAGAGAWALILGRLAGAAGGTVYRIVASRWVPSRRFSWAVVRADLGFNLGFLGIGLGGFANKNLDNWVISRTASAASLGSYYVAYVVPNILRQRMTWLSNELVFPMLSRAEGPDAQRRMYERMIALLTMLAFPVLVGVAAVAPEVIAVGFGDQWSDAVAPLRILSLAAAADVLVATATPVFLSRGRPGVANRIAAGRLAVLVVGLVLAVRAGGDLADIAWAVAASTVAAVGVTWVGLSSLLSLPVRRLVRLVVPAAVGSAVMYGAVELLRREGPEPGVALGRMALYAVVGAVVFSLTAWLLDRAAVRDWLRFARELVTRRAA